MIDGLLDETLHVALMIRPFSGDLGKLTFEKLAEFAVSVALPPSHPLAKR